MNRIKIDLENCYGIKKLDEQLDFSQGRVYAIYAPNGAMKSSLAQTFKDVATEAISVDRAFPARKTVRNITDENGHDLTKESVFVVLPYDEEFGHTEKTSTLLLDPVLRREFEKLYAEIDKSKDTLLDALRKQSHSKKDIEQEITAAFAATDFYTALHRISKELEEQTETPFADTDYDRIFDDKVLTILGTQDVKAALDDYIARYNTLLEKSQFFKKGIFDYYNAGQIANTLAKNGFFEAKHSVYLNAEEPKVIHNQQELETVIANEKTTILKDPKLLKQFDKLAKILEKNETLREFQKYMLDHPALLPQLSNIAQFKQNVWKSYLKVKYDLYKDVIVKHEHAQKRRKEIEAEAAKQNTQWEAVIQIFNERFFVPFKLEVKNKLAVMLGTEAIIDLGFTYFDGNDKAPMERPELLKCLSTGEKRAFYILNVIFEVEVRKKANQETLMVIDDIADSFDYQNKYAIIQYLKDIHDDGHFKQVIMTHNFDFFRTIESRFVPYSKCLMASRNNNGITLERATGIRNIFVKDWKKAFFTDATKKIACIPFLRNLVEFTKGESDPKFSVLTSLLHWKADTLKITEADLHTVYKEICETNEAPPKGSDTPVIDIIKAQAKSCMKTAGDALEEKIVLAVAVRLAAESFMVEKINDYAFVSGITAHQTQELLARFKSQFPGQLTDIEILDRVQLMTPENIHLNSFMYEPIVDMSGEALRKLYNDASSLVNW